MSYWLKFLLFSVIIGVAKTHRFIQLVILGGLGLAGLWMVHTLAQDFNTIQSNGHSLGGIGGSLLSSFGGGSNGGSSGGTGAGRDLYKRSIPENRINWEAVLSRDPASCARSFLCQLAATEETVLSKEERLMLYLVRNSAKQEDWASKQLQEALKVAKVSKPSQCMKIYKYCPYTSQIMTTLLRVFGR